MPPRSTLPGAPCWIDLVASDLDRATSFYCGLFGWEAVDNGPEYGGYVVFTKDGGRVGGAMAVQAVPEEFRIAGTSDAWGIFLATSDADATLERAIAEGAPVLAPVMEMPGIGRSATIQDPGGATVSLWEAGGVDGFAATAEPRTPGWFELHTSAYEASVRFYETVFGWKTTVQMDAPEFKYTTLGDGDAMAAGIMDTTSWYPAGTPGQWSVYFAVASVDETIEAAVAAGATVVDPADDTPYGRLATLTDPNGARFKLRS